MLKNELFIARETKVRATFNIFKYFQTVIF